MGLDMRPMGKPKKGFEKRYVEIFTMVTTNNIPQPTFWDTLRGKKVPTKEELIAEWLENLIPTYETIKAPMVGRDQEAEEWLKEKFKEVDQKASWEDFLKEHQGYYVIPLAKEQDGVPCYVSVAQDENVFRGQFLVTCTDVLEEDLINEAWQTKLAEATLDYGTRLMAAADKKAKEKGLEYLKDQKYPPDTDEKSIESQLHIVYSLAKWLLFYGKNGHGYEADY